MTTTRRIRTATGLALVSLTIGVSVAAAAPGALDPSFGDQGFVATAAAPGNGFDFQNGMAVQRNGRIVVTGGSFMGADAGGGNWLVLRYKPNGELDSSFGDDGVVTTNMSTVGGDDEHIWDVALQPDGKIVAVGHARTATRGSDWALARYNVDGSLDASFGDSGTIVRAVGPGSGEDRLTDVSIDNAGRIVVGGRATLPAAEGGRNFAVARFDADGTLDGTYGAAGITITAVSPGSGGDHISATGIDDHGRLVAGGVANMGVGAGGSNLALTRYLPDGTLDASFDGDGIVTTAAVPGDGFEFVNDLAFDATGRIVAAGTGATGPGGTNFDWVLARYDDDGSLDRSFSDEGLLVLGIGASDDDLEALVIQPTGKIVGGGTSSNSGFATDDDFTVARLNPDGTLDPTFAEGGIAITSMTPSWDEIFGLAADGDGKVVASGECDMGATGVDVCVARYKAGD